MDSIRFGSKDSLDVDELIIAEQLGALTELKAQCAKGSSNKNIAVVEDGIVVDCFKGAPDETNNAVFFTHSLHEQSMACPITRPVKRNVILKTVRATRVVLSLLSRTMYRAEIKKALRSQRQDQRLDVLQTVIFGELSLDIHTVKTIAFQLGQAYLLIGGIEVYTKSDLAHHLPMLGLHLQRNEEVYLDVLDTIKEMFLGELKNVYMRQNGSLNLFCYKNGAEGKKWNRYTRQARGMIIDMHKERCVQFPSEKFFKFEEREETQLDVLLTKGEPEIVEKIDGSMVSCFKFENNIHWACKGNFDVEQSQKAAEIMPVDVVERMDFDNYYFVFEVVYPENRYPNGFGIVDYGDGAKLVLIFMRHRYTLETVRYEQLIEHAKTLNIPYPPVFQGNFEAVRNECDTSTKSLFKEGYVARFDDGTFVKIKYGAYKKTLLICNHLRSHQFFATYLALSSDEREAYLDDLPDYVHSVAVQSLDVLHRKIEDIRSLFSDHVEKADGDLPQYVKENIPSAWQKAFFKFARRLPVEQLLEKIALEDLKAPLYCISQAGIGISPMYLQFQIRIGDPTESKVNQFVLDV